LLKWPKWITNGEKQNFWGFYVKIWKKSQKGENDEKGSQKDKKGQNG
jgi:hypothetical protein